MAEGGHQEELSRSKLKGSEDGDLGLSMVMGSQDVHEFYCEPCDEDDNHVEGTFYCRNCTEYMCNKCSAFHIKFKQSRDHDIRDVQYMTHKPPVSKKPPRAFTMATHVKDIKVAGPFHSSALMTANQLLVADHNKIRLLDTGSGRQVSKLAIPPLPWQVTRISDTKAAVTLPFDNKIALLKTQPKLSVVREICVSKLELCCGIAYMDNKLVVIYQGGQVDILDMSGKVLRTILADQSSKKIFTEPDYVTVNRATGSIYVSDKGEGEKRRLVKLSMKGIVEAAFTFTTKDNDIDQVTLDSQGMVYLACKNSRMLGLLDSFCVDQLNANLIKVRTIISDLSQPATLSYDDATKQLYVGLVRDVKVYKLSKRS